MADGEIEKQMRATIMQMSHVNLAIPANIGQFSLVRGVAAALATQLRFDVDAMIDLRVAVDSINRAMVEFARPGAEIYIGFIGQGQTVTIAATIPVEDNAPIDDYSRQWLTSQYTGENFGAYVVDVQGELALELTLDISADGESAHYQ